LSKPDPRTAAAEGDLRLLCDEMLKGIVRWLRAAGYDVVIADDGAHDDELLARARAKNRLLLTCDRRLAARAGKESAAAALGSESLDEAARELSARLGIDWLHAPFTRCLVDNTRLAPAAEEDVAGPPTTARQGAGPILRCPRCAAASSGRAVTCSACVPGWPAGGPRAGRLARDWRVVFARSTAGPSGRQRPVRESPVGQARPSLRHYRCHFCNIDLCIRCVAATFPLS
jgi:uncharacterized protein